MSSSDVVNHFRHSSTKPNLFFFSGLFFSASRQTYLDLFRLSSTKRYATLR